VAEAQCASALAKGGELFGRHVAVDGQVFYCRTEILTEG